MEKAGLSSHITASQTNDLAERQSLGAERHE
jgi:hypothetical protein